MGIEIEAKMRVPSLDAVRARLRVAGATLISRVLETNVFLDAPDHRLRRADSGLRIRQAGRSVIITFKGPQQSGELKRREEIEMTVESLEVAETLLSRLGFVRDLMFEKRRESWELAGCRVELDELPILGTFVEIEGPDESSILSVRRALGLSEAPLVKTGYAHLVAEALAIRADPAKRELTFS